MKRAPIPLTAVALALLALAVSHPLAVAPALAATCSEFPNQAAAQRAHDTRDGDGDGICEDLPCPCATGGGTTQRPPVTTHPQATGRQRPRGVVSIGVSATRYPHIGAHFLRTLRRGWPRTLVAGSPGADARHDRLLEGIPTRAGMDHDEDPPAVGRGRGRT